MKNDFKGNKQYLPSKLCAVCSRTMTWRKSWAKNWESVLYCSDACRAQKAGKKAAGPKPMAAQPHVLLLTLVASLSCLAAAWSTTP